MINVTETKRIHVNADTLWRKVGAFGGVGDWHPLLAKVESDGEQVGSHRTAETRQGDRQIERLDEMDPQARCYRYSMESTPMAVQDYHAEFCVADEGSDVSTVVWSAHFHVTAGDESQTVGAIRSFLRAGLDNLAKMYA